MSEKEFYVEQPAFETNKFVEGDRVRVYGEYETPLEAYVQWVDDNYVKVSSIDYHFKACRLLKKREPREWLGFSCSKNFGRFICLHSCKECDGECESFKVREVLDE